MAMARRAFAHGFILAVFVSSTALAQTQTPAPQQQRKLSDAERREFQAVTVIADDAASGKAAPNDLQLTWADEAVLKAQGNKQYIPFTVTVDPTKVNGNTVWVYWRAMAKGAAAPAAPAAPATPQKDGAKPPAAPQFAYEDLNTASLKAGSGGMARISRSVALEAGEYDVVVVVKEPTPEKRGAAAPKVSVVTHSVTVPDFWNNELNTSSVFVAERIDPLPAPLTPQQQAERPYALGTMEIIPATTRRFPKSGELSTFLLIYNAQLDAGNKPAVTVEFNFYTKQGDGEKFFNRTEAQHLNAQTLPPEFNAAAGHQLQSGQAIGLAPFPEGDYRLEIKVTDTLANKSVTRDVNFTVAGS
jgi:hypothetical protein